MLSSPLEWGIVAAAALLLFGPKKFPELGRALGQGIGNFKKALNEAQDQVSAGIEEAEQSGKKSEKAEKGSDKSAKASSSGSKRSPETHSEPSESDDS